MFAGMYFDAQEITPNVVGEHRFDSTGKKVGLLERVSDCGH